MPTSLETRASRPVSSKTSLTQASAALSPGSIPPPGRHQRLLSSRWVIKTLPLASSKMIAEAPGRNTPAFPILSPNLMMLIWLTFSETCNFFLKYQS
jgi:hypothetical protein